MADVDEKKLAALDFDEMLKIEAMVVSRIANFDHQDYTDVREGQLVLNAYKELRQHLLTMIKIDDGRRDREEVVEMRKLVKELERHADSLRNGGEILMGPAPEWEQ